MEGKRIDSKLLLFTLVLILITLLLLNWLLSNNREDKIWNYKEITTASELIYLGEIENDRETYYILENIIQQYLNSYIEDDTSNKEDKQRNYMEYYDYLTKNYRKYLSKSEYKQLAQTFLNKFYVDVESEYETMQYMDVEEIIRRVYSFENDVYLCELRSSYTGQEGYIAIALDANRNIYNIVYIE